MSGIVTSGVQSGPHLPISPNGVKSSVKPLSAYKVSSFPDVGPYPVRVTETTHHGTDPRVNPVRSVRPRRVPVRVPPTVSDRERTDPPKPNNKTQPKTQKTFCSLTRKNTVPKMSHCSVALKGKSRRSREKCD